MPNTAQRVQRMLLTRQSEKGTKYVQDSGITAGDDCEFTVYTRWGTPVFNQEVYNNAWGGTTDGGSALEDGTYYFVLTHNNEIRVKSAVTILNNF